MTAADRIRAEFRGYVAAALALPEAEGRERVAVTLALSINPPALSHLPAILAAAPLSAAVAGEPEPVSSMRAFVARGGESK